MKDILQLHTQKQCSLLIDAQFFGGVMFLNLLFWLT